MSPKAVMELFLELLLAELPTTIMFGQIWTTVKQQLTVLGVD
tara:strand:+ start:461 stop:586 length:126 start_codon:yes stop_codon:yes gene_type:complete